MDRIGDYGSSDPSSTLGSWSMSYAKECTSVKQFKTDFLEAWEQFIITTEIEPDDEYYNIDDFDDYKELIRECGDREPERVDSDYIHRDYFLISDDGKWRYEVSGSSYRKDMSICDQEMHDEIYITDLALERQAKETKKLSGILQNVKLWEDFVYTYPDNEDLLNELKKYKFPKKL